MKVLIGVDGSAASFDAVRVAAKLVHPAVDEVAIYFSPSDIHKKLAGRASGVVEDLTRSIFEEALLDVQFELPSRSDVTKCVVTRDSIDHGNPPMLVTDASLDGPDGAIGIDPEAGEQTA
ncbi:MAG: hypothetical protein ACKOL0_07450 [Solirubrobacterales bacterium]